MGKVEQFVAHDVDASKIKRISLIAGSGRRGDMQVLARARERLTAAGVPLVKRAGSWETNEAALREICVQRPDSAENVDGVLFVQWDRLTLHDCASLAIATSITGGYAGIDALVDRLVRFMGITPPPAQ